MKSLCKQAVFSVALLFLVGASLFCQTEKWAYRSNSLAVTYSVGDTLIGGVLLGKVVRNPLYQTLEIPPNINFQNLDPVLNYSDTGYVNCCNKDSVYYRTVKFQIGPGVFFDSTFKFIIKVPEPIIIREQYPVYVYDTTYIYVPVHDTVFVKVPYPVHDTTYLTDTIYVEICPEDTIIEPPTPPIDTTIKDTTTNASILIRNSGTQVFDGWNITMTNPSGIAFYSYQKDLTVNLTLKNIRQRGGGNVIWSSMTGAAGAKSNFLIENGDFRTKTSPIAIYSAYNLVDRVTIRNTILKPEQSHGAYINSNINVTMEGVVTDSMGVGINSNTALSFSHFSSNGVPGEGQTTNYFTRCKGNTSNPWRFSGNTYLDRDTMELYNNQGDRSLFLHAKNSVLSGWFKGEADSIKGKALYPYDTAFINVGQYESMSMSGGKFEFRKFKVGDIFGMTTNGTGAPVFAIFDNCEIGAVANIPAGSIFYLKGTTKQPPAKWNNPYQPTYIRL